MVNFRIEDLEGDLSKGISDDDPDIGNNVVSRDGTADVFSSGVKIMHLVQSAAVTWMLKVKVLVLTESWEPLIFPGYCGVSTSLQCFYGYHSRTQ